MALARFSLKEFEPHVEAEYQREVYRSDQKTSRAVLTMISILVIIAGILATSGGHLEIGRALTFVAGPLFAFGAGLTFINLHPRVSQFTTPAAVAIAALTSEVIALLWLPEYVGAYQANIHFVFIFFLFACTRVVLRYKVRTATALVLALIALNFWHYGVNRIFVGNVLMSGVLAMCVGWVVAYRLEFLERENFMRVRSIREGNLLSEHLLRSVLPDRVYDRYLAGDPTAQDLHQDVAVLFCRLQVRFAAEVSEAERLRVLNRVFSDLDDVTSACRIEKIKTVGTVYLAVAGLYSESSDALERGLVAALKYRDAVQSSRESTLHAIDVTIGLDRGQVASGVIGSKTIAFDIWGSVCNRASRLADLDAPGQILIPAECTPMATRFTFEPPRSFQLRGIGALEVVNLAGRHGALREEPA